MLLYWLISILYVRSARQNQIRQIVNNFDFDLSCNIIDDPEVNNIVKMKVAGEKIQLLAPSQNARDADGCTIKVAGKTVLASDSLVLLGIEIDRRLDGSEGTKNLEMIRL